MVKFISQNLQWDRRHNTSEIISSPLIPSIGPHLLQYVHPLVYLGGPRAQGVGSFKWNQKSRYSSGFTCSIVISLNGTNITHVNSLWGIESHVENQIKVWSKTLLPVSIFLQETLTIQTNRQVTMFWRPLTTLNYKRPSLSFRHLIT